MDTPNLDQITNLAAQQKAGSAGFLAGQQGQQSDFLNKYTNFINSSEGLGAMSNRINQELGIPQLQTNATNLRNLITNMPQTYSKATTGYDVSNSQLQRIIAQKMGEVAPALATAETSLTGAQNTADRRMQYSAADQARMEKPLTLEQSLLADRQARETTMFSADMGRELDALINKIQMGVTLSEGEKSRANALSIAEKGYQNALDLAKQKTGSSGSNLINVSEGTSLFDPTTGKVVYSKGKTYQPSGTPTPTVKAQPTLQSTPGTSTFRPN